MSNWRQPAHLHVFVSDQHRMAVECCRRDYGFSVNSQLVIFVSQANLMHMRGWSPPANQEITFVEVNSMDGSNINMQFWHDYYAIKHLWQARRS
jgi:hypothetical protein